MPHCCLAMEQAPSTPYMAFAVLDDLVKRGDVRMNYETAESN